MFEEKPLRHRVFHFIRIALDIGRVEARNGREVIDPGNEAILKSGSMVCRTSLPKSFSSAGALKSRTSAGGRSSKLASRSERLTLPFPGSGVVLVGIWLWV